MTSKDCHTTVQYISLGSATDLQTDRVMRIEVLSSLAMPTERARSLDLSQVRNGYLMISSTVYTMFNYLLYSTTLNCFSTLCGWNN